MLPGVVVVLVVVVVVLGVVLVVGKFVVVLVVGMVVVGYGVLFSQDTSSGQLQTFKLGSNRRSPGQDIGMGMLPWHSKNLLQS